MSALDGAERHHQHAFMKSLIIVATITVILGASPAAAHLPADCQEDGSELQAALAERGAATSTITAALDRFDITAILEALPGMIEADRRFITANNQFLRCVLREQP